MGHLAHEGIESIHGHHKHIQILLSLVKEWRLTPTSSRPFEPLSGLIKGDWILREADGDAELKCLQQS